jgi:alpha-1,6-mannosyltransferase
MNTGTASKRFRGVFWLTICGLEIIFLWISIRSHGSQHIRELWILYMGAFGPFVLLLGVAHRVRPPLWVVFLVALIFRATLLFSFPVFSDDVFRYLWEGKMQIHGINPFVVAPADPATEPFRDATWALVNHKSIPTIYPPASMLFFRACMALSYNLYFFKGMLICLDLGLLLLLAAVVKQRGLSTNRLLVYAWHPLVVVEIAGSGHQDIIGLFFLGAVLFFSSRRNLLGAAVMLTGAVLSKLFPLMLFPFLVRNQKKWPYLLLVGIILVSYAVFFHPEHHLFTGLMGYTRHWHANDSVFFLLRTVFSHVMTAKVIILVVFLGFYGTTYKRVPGFVPAGFMVMGAYLILSPTLHPWYTLWILPFIIFNPNRAWIWLTMAVTLYYHVLIGYIETGTWQEELWVKGLIYIPFFVLLASSALNRKRCSHG